MTKTTNYQLNQWEKTDRIMMDDFNADNAKLDETLAVHAAALAGKVPMTVLYDETLTEPKINMEFYMGREGWTNYSIVALIYIPPENTSGEMVYIKQGPSRSSTHYDIFNMGAGAQDSFAPTETNHGFLTLFFPTRDSQFVKTMTSARTGLYFGISRLGYDNATYPLMLNGTMPAGGRIRVIGLL